MMTSNRTRLLSRASRIALSIVMLTAAAILANDQGKGKDPRQGPPIQHKGQLCVANPESCDKSYNVCREDNNNCVVNGQTVQFPFAQALEYVGHGTCGGSAFTSCYEYPSVKCLTIQVYERTVLLNCVGPKCTFDYYKYDACPTQ